MLGEGCRRPVEWCALSIECMSTLKLTTIEHHIHRDLVRWEPPPERFVKLNVDGSCSAAGNVGVGGAIKDSHGKWITGFSSNEGKGDALFVELFGVYHGLALVVNNRPTVVVFETDSEEVIQLVKN